MTCAGGGREDRRAFSGDQFPDHIAVHVGKTEVAAGMPEGELLVVKTEQCQNGGVEVVNMYFVLDGLEEPAFGPDDRGGRPLNWANYTDVPPVLVARVRPAG